MADNDQDFITEESGSSPFRMLAAALVGILLLAVLCVGGLALLNSRGDGSNGEQAGFNATSTAIANINATTIALNENVTATIAAMETEAAMPTNTPTRTPIPPTNTPIPTNTAGPTDTPVVSEVDETGTPDAVATSIFGGTPGNTPTAIPGGTGGTGGTGSTGGTGGTGNTGGGTLPSTGFGIGEALLVAAILVMVFVAARRLRSS